ncbi:TIGD6 (predicted) [Pycnogonum litorale]
MKRKRKHNFEDVDEPLLKWFRAARDKKLPVSGDDLLLKAQQFARACGYENPEKLDINWINRWKLREEIVCKKLHGEAESVDQEAVDDWLKNRLPALLKEFKAEDLFNADETTVFQVFA